LPSRDLVDGGAVVEIRLPRAHTGVAMHADAGLPTDEAPDHSMVIPPTSRSRFSKRRF
jgi:hypothetical protein